MCAYTCVFGFPQKDLEVLCFLVVGALGKPSKHYKGLQLLSFRKHL